MGNCILATFGAATVTLAAGAQPSGPSDMDGNSLVRPEAFLSHASASPEEPTALAIRFTIHEGWHTYWRNPGDTGAEMTVQYSGPEWASIGELRWPVPERYRSPGDLLDFVHHGKPVLLSELRVDSAAWRSAGSPETLAFELRCEWFVCKDICLLGEGTVRVEVGVVERAADRNADARGLAVIREAESKRALPFEQAVEHGVSARFSDGSLHIRVPGASKLTFFAYESDRLALPLDSLREAERQGDHLVIRYRDEANQVAELAGVLVVRTEDGVSRAYEIRVPTSGEPHWRERGPE